MTTEDDQKQMQIKILYSFDDNPTTFLSRSSQQFPVQTAEVPIQTTYSDVPELITLGAFELRSCIKQLLRSNPENFKLNSHDYAVYYKDITEQPDEPFVSNGVLSSLVSSKESCLIPGRVCQNVSANFLFGNKKKASSLTLEVRLKLHTIEGSPAMAICALLSPPLLPLPFPTIWSASFPTNGASLATPPLGASATPNPFSPLDPAAKLPAKSRLSFSVSAFEPTPLTMLFKLWSPASSLTLLDEDDDDDDEECRSAGTTSYSKSGLSFKSCETPHIKIAIIRNITMYPTSFLLGLLKNTIGSLRLL
ncbi:hypothetical protein KGF57_001630 [Candida theae]|uniref:Ams2/SPT21 N-terminal domain-containing protein n=1 Tax=Candida theae TaxID=1198502 RepID=A0AAD5BHA6_9ASCO|nr:uncharacterized protein KGF57_001630 [Candida theae]KAI5961696.1 hypothetical protein KGF57_001630 [Candida theae]